MEDWYFLYESGEFIYSSDLNIALPWDTGTLTADEHSLEKTFNGGEVEREQT